ncbi:MAG: hypothetical protein AB7P03_03850 [Kofleriaceae bacterium]
MPSRPDLRELASNVRQAFTELDRDTLLEILTFVVKEYVVEGPPPMLVHQAERLSDLDGCSFAQLIAALQNRFDHPELAMFVVDGDQVGVRIGGVVHPLVPGRQPLAPTELPRPAAGVRVVETTLQPRPTAPSAAAAPPPARGLSVRGQPAPQPPSSSSSSSPQPAGPPAPAPESAPPAAADKPEGGGDDAAARFSLLELD